MKETFEKLRIKVKGLKNFKIINGYGYKVMFY